MNPWEETIMGDIPDFYEPLDGTYDVSLRDTVRNAPEETRMARLTLNALHEPRRAPYPIIGQALTMPLVVGKLHTIHADICVMEGDTCLEKPTPYPQCC